MTLRRRQYLVEGHLDPSDFSEKKFWEKIDASSGNKYAKSNVVDWGPRKRGQGRRFGTMIRGAMSDAPVGNKQYVDVLGNAPLNAKQKEEADNIRDTYQKFMFAKALEAGFSPDVAFLVSYSVGDGAMDRSEIYDLAKKAEG